MIEAKKIFDLLRRKKEPDPIPRYRPDGRGGHFEFIDLPTKSAEIWKDAILEFGGRFEYCEQQPKSKNKVNINILLPCQWDYENVDDESRHKIRETLFSKVDEIRNLNKRKRK